MNELISNFLKYAFIDSSKGEIVVEIKKLDFNVIQMVVQDNGIGFPGDFDIQNTESMGLFIVNSLVGQLDGTLEVNREKGSKFIITFKGKI